MRIHDFTRDIRGGIQRLTRVYTTAYRGIQGFTGLYKGIQGLTGLAVYKGIQGYTGVYKGLNGYRRITRV